MCDSSILQKRCTVCEKEKPATAEFFHRGWNPGGLTAACKDCRNAASKAKRAPFLKGKEQLPEGMKRCTRCKEINPATREYFSPHKATADRLNCYCKGCAAEKARLRQVHKPRHWPNSPIDGMKRCRVCKEMKPATHEFFSRSRNILSGLRPSCKACDAQVEREWRLANPEKSRAKVHRRRARLSLSPSHFTSEDVHRQLDQQKSLCYWCQSKLILSGKGKYHIDHLIPLSRGGTNEPSNIVCSCPQCNFSRNNRLPHEWTNRLL